DHEYTETEHRTRPDQHIDQFEHEIPGPPKQPGTRRSFCGLSRAHRRPPGAARESMVSTSTKSLLTGGTFTLCGTWHSVQKNRRGDTDARNWPSRSMKCVIEIIGACDSAVRARA